MPPCFSFEKLCVRESGLELCQGAGVAGGCEPVTWFWLLAAVVGAGLLMAGGKR